MWGRGEKLRNCGTFFTNQSSILPTKRAKEIRDDQRANQIHGASGWNCSGSFQPRKRSTGISFEPRYNVGNIHGWPEGKHEPSGTNLFDATQATEMVRFMTDGLPPGGVKAAMETVTVTRHIDGKDFAKSSA